MSWRCPCGLGRVEYDPGEMPDKPYSNYFIGGRGWYWECPACDCPNRYGHTLERYEVTNPMPEPPKRAGAMGWIWSQPLYFYDLSDKAAYDDAGSSVSHTLDAVRKARMAIEDDVAARVTEELSSVASKKRYAIVVRMFDLDGEDAGKAFISRRRPATIARESLASPHTARLLFRYHGWLPDIEALGTSETQARAEQRRMVRPRCVHVSAGEG